MIIVLWSSINSNQQSGLVLLEGALRAMGVKEHSIANLCLTAFLHIAGAVKGVHREPEDSGCNAVEVPVSRAQGLPGLTLHTEEARQAALAEILS